MHFSIPDTQELRDSSNAPYCAYNIHVNGVFHCTVRYRQLHNFYEQLKKEYGANLLPVFPPKKILPLTGNQKEERKLMLERFIQLISQDARISNSETFNSFFLAAQQETEQETPVEVELDIYLMNGHKIPVTIMSTDQTDDVLEIVAQKIQLNEDFVFYFALYLIKKDDDNEISIVRKMQDFESPYLSQRSAGPKHRIVVRKGYWDPVFDDHLIDDRIAMNLLYVQAISDLERGWTEAKKDTHRQLGSLQTKGSKKEYIMLARTLKHYGYIQFKPCVVDYPTPGARVIINAGNKELCMRVHVAKDQVREAVFKVTRMRCWRITTSIDKEMGDVDPHLELAFEYLMSKDNLQWITIVSDQSILLSMCLQGMVDELIMKKQGGRIRRPADRPKQRHRSYMKRDGSMDMRNSSGASNGDDEHHDESATSTAHRALESVKKLSDKLSSVSVVGRTTNTTANTQPSPAKGKSFVENDAFEGIGDDDL